MEEKEVGAGAYFEIQEFDLLVPRVFLAIEQIRALIVYIIPCR